jgi:hypothetical protein
MAVRVVGYLQLRILMLNDPHRESIAFSTYQRSFAGLDLQGERTKVIVAQSNSMPLQRPSLSVDELIPSFASAQTSPPNSHHKSTRERSSPRIKPARDSRSSAGFRNPRQLSLS